MPIQSKASPMALMPKGYDVDSKLMAEMKKKRASLVSSVQFRNALLESQKRVNYVPKVKSTDYKVLTE